MKSHNQEHVFQYWHSKGVGGYKWIGSKSLCNVNTCTIKLHSIPVIRDPFLVSITLGPRR
jgi:hypothetical protein